LTDHFDRFIEKQIRAGRFRNASEVMRAGLQLLEQRTQEEHEKLALLRALATEAFDQLDRGEGIALDSPEKLAEYISRVGKRVRGKARTKSSSSR
jgi:antitoxin ParD1/3/4